MRRSAIVTSILVLLLSQLIQANTPEGFSWINLESDKATMAVVRRTLHDPSITAFREVGVKDGFALVMAASREDVGSGTLPDYDRWTIYNVRLATGSSTILVSGYDVKLVGWIGLKGGELAVSYNDCSECEPATLFTTLHFVKGVGWRARWLSPKEVDSDYPHPGAVVFISDAGEPYEDDVEVDQVFSVVGQWGKSFTAGSWFRSRNPKTKEVEDSVTRYWVDPTTGEDRIEQLHGSAALNWKREICDREKAMISPHIGQDSASCRSVLKNTPLHGTVSK